MILVLFILLTGFSLRNDGILEEKNVLTDNYSLKEQHGCELQRCAAVQQDAPLL